MPAQENLTKDDWQYISYVVQMHYNKVRPKKGEPPASKEWKAQEARIMNHLLHYAFGPTGER